MDPVPYVLTEEDLLLARMAAKVRVEDSKKTGHFHYYGSNNTPEGHFRNHYIGTRGEIGACRLVGVEFDYSRSFDDGVDLWVRGSGVDVKTRNPHRAANFIVRGDALDRWIAKSKAEGDHVYPSILLSAAIVREDMVEFWGVIGIHNYAKHATVFWDTITTRDGKPKKVKGYTMPINEENMSTAHEFFAWAAGEGGLK
jgi:hypothetical protein